MEEQLCIYILVYILEIEIKQQSQRNEEYINSKFAVVGQVL